MIKSSKPGFEGKGYEIVHDEEKKISMSSDDSSATLLEDGLGSEPRTTVAKTPRWMWYLHAALFSISAAFFVSSWFGQPTEDKFVQRFSTWSPAADAVRYEKVHFNISKGAKSSPYTGMGDEVDKMWNGLSFDIGDQMVPHEQMMSLGKPMNSLGVFDPRTGEHGFRVGLEVFHQLHCLNLLRKSTYQEYYATLPGDLSDPPEKLRLHLDHCIEILRLNLMCSSDIGVFTFAILPGYDDPWPDFNTDHVCRNFDAIKDWAIENTVATDNI